MNIEEVRTLMQMMQEGGLSYIEVEDGDKKIRLEKQPVLSGAAAAQSTAPAVIPSAVQACTSAAQETRQEYKEVKSPMVGVFYASPSPESAPYVQVGAQIGKGDVLCVIEAMKLLNELNAEFGGEVVEVCAQNGQVVEYGQTLFRLR